MLQVSSCCIMSTKPTKSQVGVPTTGCCTHNVYYQVVQPAKKKRERESFPEAKMKHSERWFGVWYIKFTSVYVHIIHDKGEAVYALCHGSDELFTLYGSSCTRLQHICIKLHFFSVFGIGFTHFIGSQLLFKKKKRS